MDSRLVVRRSTTVAAVYASAVVGFFGTVVAAHNFSTRVLGLYALVIAAAGFCKALLDFTVEDAVINYGFRYEARGDWGRLRRLFRSTFLVKVSGNVLGACAMLGLAWLANDIFGDSGLTLPLAIAALLPLTQSLEALAAIPLILRGRYDVRAGFLFLSAVLRLLGLAIGSRYGLAEAMLGIVAAQVITTISIGVAGIAALRRFPYAESKTLGRDARGIFRFVLQSSVASTVIALRAPLGSLLLGIVSSPAQVGFLRIAQSPQQGFATLSGPARLILVTDQTRAWEKGRRDVVFAGLRRFSLGTGALMVIVMPTLMWFMPDLISLLYTERNIEATSAARIILIVGALEFTLGWTKSLPTSIGRPHLRVVTHAVETIVLLPLLLVLGGPYGAAGAAFAILVSSAVFHFCWLILLLRIRRERPGDERIDLAPELARESVEPLSL